MSDLSIQGQDYSKYVTDFSKLNLNGVPANDATTNTSTVTDPVTTGSTGLSADEVNFSGKTVTLESAADPEVSSEKDGNGALKTAVIAGGITAAALGIAMCFKPTREWASKHLGSLFKENADDAIKKVTKESTEEILDEGSEKLLQEGGEKILEEGSEEILEQGAHGLVKEGTEEVLESGTEKTVQTVSKETLKKEAKEFNSIMNQTEKASLVQTIKAANINAKDKEQMIQYLNNNLQKIKPEDIPRLQEKILSLI